MTVFEKNDRVGGLLRYGIPDFKLDKTLIDRRVGQLKAEHHLPPADPSREAEQVARLRRLATDAKLDPEFAEKFLAFVVKEVIRHHERLRG